ncbi:MAG: hypothetical protein QW331_03700 [Candidatus Woesearchaeota archaeon]
MPDQRDEILNFVKEHGPVLPSHVAKAAKLSILFASAYLSELADKKYIKISWIKVGGSPLYYAPGQQEKLEKYIDNLNDKDKETFILLKEKKLLKDDEQSPLLRVSLRNLKDFAVPIQINDQLYWKYYLLRDEEVKSVYEKLFALKPETTKEEIKEQKTEKQLSLAGQEIKEEVLQEPLKRKRGRPKKTKAEEPKEITEQQTKSELPKDEFTIKAEEFFISHDMDIIECSIIKKGKEIEFIVMLPTPFGKTKYFCRVINKKSINEGDLSLTLLRAHYKKLPGLLLAPGKLAKKANEMLLKEAEGLLFKEL